MNLLEYREMKAQEEKAKESAPEVTETVQPQTTPPEETNAVPETPQITEYEINGEKVSLEELTKGYLRQSDYTKKTQEVARQSREAQEALSLFEQVKQRPEVAEALNYDPREAETRQIEQNYYDLMLEQEVSTLSAKYADFEVSEVLDFAVQRNMQSLEDAYFLNKQYKGTNSTTPAPTAPIVQSVDVDALKQQIREELLAEQNTSTIISGQGTPPATQQAPVLTASQMRVAEKMGLSPDEYMKWR